MPAPPVRAYSFTDWQVANPTAPPPGDRLDAEFDRADNAIGDVIDWASTSLNTDGSIRDGAIGSSQLQPDLFSDISGDIIADVQPLVDEAAAYAAASAASSTTAADAALTATIVHLAAEPPQCCGLRDGGSCGIRGADRIPRLPRHRRLNADNHATASRAVGWALPRRGPSIC
jgi:hypothetical protein